MRMTTHITTTHSENFVYMVTLCTNPLCQHQHCAWPQHPQATWASRVPCLVTNMAMHDHASRTTNSNLYLPFLVYKHNQAPGYGTRIATITPYLQPLPSLSGCKRQQHHLTTSPQKLPRATPSSCIACREPPLLQGLGTGAALPVSSHWHSHAHSTPCAC